MLSSTHDPTISIVRVVTAIIDLHQAVRPIKGIAILLVAGQVAIGIISKVDDWIAPDLHGGNLVCRVVCPVGCAGGYPNRDLLL